MTLNISNESFCISLKVSSKLLLKSFAFTMQEKMVGCAFQIFQENKSEDQHLTTWTRWKNMTKWKRSAGHKDKCSLILKNKNKKPTDKSCGFDSESSVLDSSSYTLQMLFFFFFLVVCFSNIVFASMLLMLRLLIFYYEFGSSVIHVNFMIIVLNLTFMIVVSMEIFLSVIISKSEFYK